MSRPTLKEATKAIEQAKGFVATAATLCNTSRTTLHDMINKHPKLKEAVQDAREKNRDFAEGKLMMAIDEGNITAIIFYLKTQGKDRGYVERQELEHSGEVNIKVEYDDPND